MAMPKDLEPTTFEHSVLTISNVARAFKPGSLKLNGDYNF